MANLTKGAKAPAKTNVETKTGNDVETLKAQKLIQKELLSDYKTKAENRDKYHIDTKRIEEGSVLHHLKDTQRREFEYQKEIISNEIKNFETDKAKELKKESYKVTNADIKNLISENSLKISEVYTPYAIDYAYFRQGANIFKLLGFLTPANAIMYGLNDKVKHSTAIKLLSDYSEQNYFAHITAIEAKFLKADALSEARKTFLATSRTEKQLHTYLLKIDALFNVQSKDKGIKKYGSATAKALFKNALYSLIKLQNSHFESVDLKKICIDIALTATDKSKFNEAQKRFIFEHLDKAQTSKFLASGFETIEGGNEALKLLNDIEAAKNETKNQRSKVQTERKAKKETATV